MSEIATFEVDDVLSLPTPEEQQAACDAGARTVRAALDQRLRQRIASGDHPFNVTPFLFGAMSETASGLCLMTEAKMRPTVEAMAVAGLRGLFRGFPYPINEDGSPFVQPGSDAGETERVARAMAKAKRTLVAAFLDHAQALAGHQQGAQQGTWADDILVSRGEARMAIAWMRRELERWPGEEPPNPGIEHVAGHC